MVEDPTGPAPGPPGFERELPVPWEPVWGKRDGWTQRIQTRAVAGLIGLAARLPEGVFQALLGGLARVAKAFDRRHSQAARVFLTTALGEMPRAELEARVLRAYRHLFQIIVEPRRFELRVPLDKRQACFDVHWTEEARAASRSAEGCIVLTAHLGHFEGGLSVVPWLGFAPVYAVAKPPQNRPLSILSQQAREALGVNLLARRGAMQRAPAVIRAGGTILMLLDQRARKRPILAPFFGRPARCDRSAGVLLKRLRVPVHLCACTLTDVPQRYSLVFYDCIQPEEVAGMAPEEISTRINKVYERMILEHPDQYFWLHDRYKDTPATFPGGEENAAVVQEDKNP